MSETRDIRFLPATMREIASRSRLVRTAVLEAAQAGRADLEEKAKQNLTRGRPFLNRGTGRLLSETKAVLKPGSGEVTIALETSKVGYVHQSGALILPTRGKYLKFRVAGRFVQVRRVVIPARPWMSDALERAGARMPTRLRQALDDVLGRAV